MDYEIRDDKLVVSVKNDYEIIPREKLKTLFDKFVSQYDETSPCPIQLAFAGENYIDDLRKMILEKFPNANIQEGPVGPFRRR